MTTPPPVPVLALIAAGGLAVAGVGLWVRCQIRAVERAIIAAFDAWPPGR